MPAYMISYDLRKVRNYDALVKQLKDWDCIAPLQSLWLGQLRGNSVAFRQLLAPLIDGDDGLLIIEIKPTADWAYLRANDARTGDWLKNNLGSEI
ncbi:hypothetical protein [Rhizobium leguminosarum]|uniref:hypothetical protein n=1 Tax=Rhizobium leguminosarum TaxID=384 RepID=UPI003F9A1E72